MPAPNSRILHWLAAGLLAALSLAAGGGAHPLFAESPLLHRRAPEFVRTGLNHRRIDLHAYRGKLVLLNFWATWCAPCVASMPHLKELREKFKDQDVLIVGVSCDSPMQKETPAENHAKVAKFVADKGYSWTHTYAGKWPDAAVKYGVSRIPTVFVLGKDGRILSTTARGREETLIQQALAAPQA